MCLCSPPENHFIKNIIILFANDLLNCLSNNNNNKFLQIIMFYKNFWNDNASLMMNHMSVDTNGPKKSKLFFLGKKLREIFFIWILFEISSLFNKTTRVRTLQKTFKLLFRHLVQYYYHGGHNTGHILVKRIPCNSFYYNFKFQE